ncbi:RNA polymerase sigma-70 factor (ECF subfamily) [Paenibacillus endophyticus]|uniref:RNA polymerase sigma-70 factor (ECF subfamily) n=1 Tax=Paenibacillus endophyticus TaxID=1294268 RepID=A0A7W5G9F1_9BACL|nr:sigma-70 family RNA polymerase sigma factor [Paenibacillus endophyticus]MBB3151586.1 RNA polymerase sigma-70 factor (ECF subfamily) [Paenibacillus endophyticus]
MEQWFSLLRNPIGDLDIDTQKWVYRSFYQFVYHDTLFLTHDRTLTEDIIQDAFIKASAKGPGLGPDTHLPGWTKAVARNTTIDYLRKLKKDRKILSTSSVNINEASVHEISVASEIETKERNELLRQAINELKPEYRTVLIMFYMERKSYREICKELHIIENVLSQRLVRARKKLLVHFLRKWTNVNELL